jgi:hypothetical protein
VHKTPNKNTYNVLHKPVLQDAAELPVAVRITTFLEAHHSITKYATTGKGLEFLEKWSELKLLLS